ncbi:LOW QUALITY PROTEIN: solute carrier family 22 member 6-A-like [Liolophura sinensis]|uniref:LOW QUALITY PROTEIN: solute carrier family 22 member 6-A-like n=1 Tax=Liolophura sinensis TaxID=3198878 RepID=UPI0031595F0F
MFPGYEPPFSCLVVDNTTELLEHNVTHYVQEGDCKVRDTWTNVTSPCHHGYWYDAPLETATIVTEWDLVCDKEYQMQLTQTIFVAGQALGATVMTILADRYGRKWVCIISQWAMFAIGVGTAFSPSILVFSILRFPTGAFQQGIVMTGSVLPLEIIPVEKRAIVHLIGTGTWSINLALMSGLGYLFQEHNWRYLQLAFSSASLMVLLQTFLLDESLRWLYANNKGKRAAQIIQKAIRKNKADINTVLQACLDYGDNKSMQMKVALKPVTLHPVTQYHDNALDNKSTPKESLSNISAASSLYDNEPTGCLEKSTPADSQVTASAKSEEVLGNNGRFHEDSKTSVMGFVPDQEGDIKASSPRTTSKESDELLLDDKLVAPPAKKYTVLDVIRMFKCCLRKHINVYNRLYPLFQDCESLVYFGLTLASSKLAGDRFVNFALIAAVELPSGIISYLTMQRFGRKATIFIFDGIAGTALIAAVALKEVYGNGLAVTALSITGKFGASAAFGSLFTYTPELYPTNLRSLGLGISSASARIGGMIAPFSLLVMKYYPWVPGTVFGSLSLVVCGLVLFLPETKDKELPQTIEEIEKWSKK